VSPEGIAAVGALCTGVASLVTALLSSKKQVKRGLDDCDKRVEELRKVFYAGIQFKNKNFPDKSR
jgi:hypothetical protein